MARPRWTMHIDGVLTMVSPMGGVGKWASSRPRAWSVYFWSRAGNSHRCRSHPTTSHMVIINPGWAISACPRGGGCHLDYSLYAYRGVGNRRRRRDATGQDPHCVQYPFNYFTACAMTVCSTVALPDISFYTQGTPCHGELCTTLLASAHLQTMRFMITTTYKPLAR